MGQKLTKVYYVVGFFLSKEIVCHIIPSISNTYFERKSENKNRSFYRKNKEKVKNKNFNRESKQWKNQN